MYENEGGEGGIGGSGVPTGISGGWNYLGGVLAQGDATLSFCTLVENGQTEVSGPATLVNSIAWNPSLGWAPLSADVLATACLVSGGFPGPGNLDADPKFVDADAGDFHLAADSPCIDAADPAPAAPAELPAFDFEGEPRVLGGSPDIGADERPGALKGTGDDLALVLVVDGVGSAAVPPTTASTGSTLATSLASPGGTLDWSVPFLLLQLHDGSGLGPDPFLAGLQVDTTAPGAGPDPDRSEPLRTRAPAPGRDDPRVPGSRRAHRLDRALPGPGPVPRRAERLPRRDGRLRPGDPLSGGFPCFPWRGPLPPGAFPLEPTKTL